MPLPRCLDNKLRLKIFPADVVNSQQDNEDGARWDVSTHPPLNNHRNQPWRNSSTSGHAADNDSETSDTGSGGDGDTNIIQGTFYSYVFPFKANRLTEHATRTDRLRLRWAAPSPSLQPGELHQATWERAEARLNIYILQVLWDPHRPGLCKGLRLRLEYSATCKGVHFPGVAALLATDLMLDDRGQGATWADRDDFQDRWDITAGAGLHGIDAGDALNRSNPDSRRTSTSSFDDGSIPGTPDIFDGRRSARTSQIPVPAAASSLLSVPLPNPENVADYSFENHPPTEMMSPTRRPASVMSSASGVSQLTTSVTGRSDGMSSRRSPEPTTLVTLQINVDQIVPKTRQEKSQFQFEANGTVDIAAPGSHLSSGDSDDAASDPAQETEFILPLFRLLDVQDERFQITVVTNTADPILLAPPEPEPGTTSSGSILSRYSSRSGRPRSFKQLSKDKPVACAMDSRLIVQPAAMPATPIQRDRGLPGSFEAEETPMRSHLGSDLRMPTLDLGGTTVPRTSLVGDAMPAVSSPTGGTQSIPWVHAYIEEAASSVYQAVRIRIPAAAISGHRLDMTLGPSSKELEVNLIYATVAGRPIDGVVHASRGAEDGAIGIPGTDPAAWISLDIGGTVPTPASDIEFMYRFGPSTTKARTTQSTRMIPLPSFAIPVAFVRVEVSISSGMCSIEHWHNVSNLFADMEVHANTDQWDQHMFGANNIVLTKFSLADGLAPDVLLNTKVVSQSRRGYLLGWASVGIVLSLALAAALAQLRGIPIADQSMPLPPSSLEANQSQDPVLTTYSWADETASPAGFVVDARQARPTEAARHVADSLSLHSQDKFLAWLRSFASQSMVNHIFQWFATVRGWGMAVVTWPQPQDPLYFDL